jgi:hypothetical protein
MSVPQLTDKKKKENEAFDKALDNIELELDTINV